MRTYHPTTDGFSYLRVRFQYHPLIAGSINTPESGRWRRTDLEDIHKAKGEGSVECKETKGVTYFMTETVTSIYVAALFRLLTHYILMSLSSNSASYLKGVSSLPLQVTRPI